MSGYTTSISQEDAYKQKEPSSTSKYTSYEVVEKLKEKIIFIFQIMKIF